MNPTEFRFGLRPAAGPSLLLPRTVLPLKSVRYRFEVRGGIAEVEMTQVYRQENPQALDCEYLFPLPADAAVFRCQAVIDGRVIEARIEERLAAIRIAESRRAEGYRTVLVESERANLFTLSLGNIQPQDVVEIKLAYVQPLRSVGGTITLDLPLCPGERYIPGSPLLRSNRGRGTSDDTDQVPDASRIMPPRVDGGHPDAAFVVLEGRIGAYSVEGPVQSPTHTLQASIDEADILVVLATGGDILDRDIALRWVERRPTLTSRRGWISRHGSHAYALLELAAPVSADSTEAVGQDLYFLVDRSGSMNGLKWQKAVQALHACIGTLGSQDRAWITLFSSSFNDFDTVPRPSNELSADTRYQQLEAVGTGGGTEMRTALVHVLEQTQRFSKERPSALILITDAQIGNDGAITEAILQYPGVPVHCLGIDSRLNDALLMDIIRQQGGTFHALQPSEDVSAIVTRLGRTLRQPVLLDLRPPTGWEPAAVSLPNLYAGQTNVVSLRTSEVGPPETIHMHGRNRDGSPASFEFCLSEVPGDTPRLRWCMERLITLVSRDRQAAVALSKEANLLCPLTAFVAWDEREKVTIARHVLVQPSVEANFFLGAIESSQGLVRGSVEGTVRYSSQPYTRLGNESSMRCATSHHSPFENIPEDFKALWNNLIAAVSPEDHRNLLSRILSWIDSFLPAETADKARLDVGMCLGLLDKWIAARNGPLGADPQQPEHLRDTTWEAHQLKTELRKAIIEFVSCWVLPRENRLSPTMNKHE